MSSGVGPGAITEDGCPVEVYAALPPRAEATWIRDSLAPGASVLDLGAGTGGLAEPLAEAGHRVVAVDDSLEMLSHLRHAETVHARIEDVRLDERFDLVLLASHLVNTPNVAQRSRFLATAAHHLAPNGRALLEWHRTEWFDALGPGSSQHGSIHGFAVTLHVHGLTNGLVTATVVYERDGTSWRQDFEALRLTHGDLEAALADAHLSLRREAAPGEDWIVARPERMSL